MCSPVEDHDLVPSLSHNIESQTHSRVSECDGRPSVQVEPSAVNRMVTASVDFSTPSVKQISDSFIYLYQDPNRRPSTIDGYRTAIDDTLGPAGHHIAHSSDLHRLLSSFHRDLPKSSRNLPNGTFLLFSMSSQKHSLSL